MQCVIQNTELSSHEGTRCQFNGGRCAIKLGIDVHQDFYVVVMQEDLANPKPPQRFGKEAFLHWAAKLKSRGGEVYAVYEACGFGFSLQRCLSALSIKCYVVCPQKLDEQNKRVKTDGWMPRRSACGWIALCKAIVLRWPLCECPAKNKNALARFSARGLRRSRVRARTRGNNRNIKALRKRACARRHEVGSSQNTDAKPRTFKVCVYLLSAFSVLPPFS
jgi:hypothetical protein